MGDTATNICDHETSIMLALSAFVLERSVLILDIAHSLCQLDCLLSLATVARENNWCRPDVVDQGTVVIRYLRPEFKFPVKIDLAFFQILDIR